MPDPNQWIVRDSKGRFASKGYRSPRGTYGGKTDIERQLDYYDYLQSRGLKMISKNTKADDFYDKEFGKLFLRMRGSRK